MSYDLFISYSCPDNREGRVTQLVERIKADFEAFGGRPGRPLEVFFDVHPEEGIKGMDDWRHSILEGLARCWAENNHQHAGWLLNQVGQRWHRLAEWMRAEPLMRRHLNIFFEFTRTTGHPHPLLQTAVINHAHMLRTMGLEGGEILAKLKEWNWREIHSGAKGHSRTGSSQQSGPPKPISEFRAIDKKGFQ